MVRIRIINEKGAAGMKLGEVRFAEEQNAASLVAQGIAEYVEQAENVVEEKKESTENQPGRRGPKPKNK